MSSNDDKELWSGGWLSVMQFFLVGVIPITNLLGIYIAYLESSILVSYYAEKNMNMNIDYNHQIDGISVFYFISVGMAVYSLLIGIKFMKKSKDAINSIRVFFFCQIVASVVLATSFPLFVSKNIWSNIFVILIWLIYTFNSKRIKKIISSSAE